MPFVTDDDVLDRLAAVLKKPSRTDLEPYWATIVERANADAYNEIVRQLVLKGYTQEQVDGPPAWIHGAEYQEALALYWALEYGGGLEEVERRQVHALRRATRDEDLRGRRRPRIGLAQALDDELDEGRRTRGRPVLEGTHPVSVQGAGRGGPQLLDGEQVRSRMSVCQVDDPGTALELGERRILDRASLHRGGGHSARVKVPEA